MGSSEFIILLFNRMAVAPHLVRIFIQGELLPGIMGEVHRKYDGDNVTITINHAINISPLIEAKIRELYNLQAGDYIRIIEVYDNQINYEIYRIRGPGNFQAVVRPKNPGIAMANALEARLRAIGPPPHGGKRRSTRKTKRRSTRRLKPRRHTK